MHTCVLLPVGIKQSGNIFHQTGTNDKGEIISIQCEPVALEVFGRYFPHPEHKFKIEAFQCVYFNKGIDSRPDWELVHASDYTGCLDYIKRQTTKIHLRPINKA